MFWFLRTSDNCIFLSRPDVIWIIPKCYILLIPHQFVYSTNRQTNYSNRIWAWLDLSFTQDLILIYNSTNSNNSVSTDGRVYNRNCKTGEENKSSHSLKLTGFQRSDLKVFNEVQGSHTVIGLIWRSHDWCWGVSMVYCADKWLG